MVSAGCKIIIWERNTDTDSVEVFNQKPRLSGLGIVRKQSNLSLFLDVGFQHRPHWLERKGLSVSWDALLEWIHKFSRIKHRCGRSELVYTKKSSLAKLYPHVRISEIKLRLHLRSRLCSCPSHKNAILDLSTAGITAIHDFWKNETFSSNSIREENQRKTVLAFYVGNEY